MILSRLWKEEFEVPKNKVRWLLSDSGQKSISLGFTKVNPYPKAGCITRSGFEKWNCNYIIQNGKWRFLYREELETLQTMPKGYCDILTYRELNDVLGDGWTIDVIAHILKHF